MPKGHFERRTAETKQFGEDIFTHVNKYMDLMQNLGFEREKTMADLQQSLFMRRFSEQQKDVGLQEKLGRLGMSALPTRTDMLFQAGLGGLGSGIANQLRSREQERQGQSYMQFLLTDGGKAPLNYGIW